MVTDESATARERVHFGSPAEWVSPQEIDLEYRAPSGTPESVLLIDHQYHADRQESYFRLARRLETPATVQQCSQWRCDFDPATQRVTIHSIAIRRDDQVIEQDVQRRLRFLHREENLDRFVLDGTLSIVLLLEDVRVGDVLDASYTIATTPRIFPDHFASVVTIPTSCYARRFRMSVRFSPARPMRWRTDSTKIKLQERTLANGEQEWMWQVERFSPREPEPGMPPWHFHGRYIQFSNFPDWAFVASGMSAAWNDDFQNTELQKCLQAIQSEATLEDRVEKTLRWVQDDLRYLSVNTELGGQIPSNPGAVLQRRFGDCKDKAFLVAHLLRMLGVPARPVLVNSVSRHRVGEFLPAPGLFNHAIVEFELSGKRRWVDTTIPLQGGGPLGRSVPSFGFGLPIGPGVVALEPIEAPADSYGRYELREVFRLELKETLSLVVAVTATGSYADELRHQHVFEASGEVARTRERFYKTIFPIVRRTAEPEMRDDRARNEFTVAESFSFPGAITVLHEGELAGFQFPAHLMQGMLGFPDSEKRTQPLALPYPCTAEQRIEYEFETLMRTGTQAINVRTNELTFQGKCNQTGGRTVLTYSLRTKADHVPADQFPVHRRKVIEALIATRPTIYVIAGSKSSAPRRTPASMLPASPLVSSGTRTPAPASLEAMVIAPALLSPVPVTPGSSSEPTNTIRQGAQNAGTQRRSEGRRSSKRKGSVRRLVTDYSEREAHTAWKIGVSLVFLGIVLRVVIAFFR